MWEENAMRALRVLGLAENGEHLVCEDGTSGELFTVPADEKLQAATRGDLSRLGQLEIELAPQLRPREIQSRIRAGESLAEVASAASTTIGRIERYAYPVLLERSTTAERARRSHPIVDGNPTRKTLEELVLSTLSQRGQGGDLRWDAYRDETGWVLSLRWHAGRSENHAEWEVHPGPRANTLHPKDDTARDLVDPAPPSLRPITEPADPEAARRATEAAQVVAVVEPEHAQDFLPRPDVTGNRPGSGAARHPAGSRRALADRLDQEQLVEPQQTAEGLVLDERSGTNPALPAEQVANGRSETVRTGTDNAAPRPHRRQRPVMPGWEDVLLGGQAPGR